MTGDYAAGEADEHRTHVERQHDGTHYWWCEADECYRPSCRYASEAEALDAARAHEDHPG